MTTQPASRAADTWHLDKKVPVSIIVTLPGGQLQVLRDDGLALTY